MVAELKHKPYKFQKEGVKLIEQCSLRTLLADEMGLGKAQPHYAKLASPTGWTTMGEIREGDYVMGCDGKPTKVIGVFPQGKKDVYKVTFSDGSSTECCDEHLWYVQRAWDRHKGLPGKVKPLKELMGNIKKANGNRQHFIPMASPVEYKEKPLPLHPYLVGYLIANGCLVNNSAFSAPDTETIDRLQKLLPTGLIIKYRSGIDYAIVKKGEQSSLPNEVIAQLRELELIGCHSHNKHIPHGYLYNTIKNRCILLKGLMDGDGSVCGNHLEYSTSSEKLAAQVRELVMSLGGTARIHQTQPTYKYKDEIKNGLPHYKISISIPNTIKPFKLSRKADEYKGRNKYPPCRAIDKVEYIGKVLCSCIKVDAPNSLYLTDDFIVTHNTYQALLAITRNQPYPVVVICPAIAKYVWQEEAFKHCGVVATVLEGRTPSKYGMFKPGNIVIINYDILGAWMDWLKKLKPRMVVIDECQYLQNLATKRTTYTREVCHKVPHILAMSGTPLVNNPFDLYPALHILWPKEFESPINYGDRYCKKTYFRGQIKYRGGRNLAELHNRLMGLGMVRRRVADVLQDLPPKNKYVIPVPLHDPKGQYKKAETEFLKWVASKDSGRSRRAARSEGLAYFGELRKLAAKLKMRAVGKWHDDFFENTEQKLITFAWHQKCVDAFYNRYKSMAVCVKGGTPAKQRAAAARRFNTDPKCRLFVANLMAAGTAITLNGAQTTAYAELDTRPGIMDQADKRNHRIGQNKPTFSNYFVGNGTIETRICRMLQEKQDIISATLDGGKMYDDFDIYDELVESIAKELKVA